MASKLSRMTTDHDEIRRWAEERGAHPAEVERTERNGETGMIRLDFPGFSGAGSLKPISWDEWFEKFDDSKLALVYQDRTARGEKSNFNKLIARETAEARAEGDNEASRRSLRGRAGGGGRRSGSLRSTSARSAASRSGRASTRTAASRRSSTRGGKTSARGGTGRQRAGTGSRRGAAAQRQAPRTIAARLTGRARMPMAEGTSRGGKRRSTSRAGRSPSRTSSSSRKGTRRSSRRTTRSSPRGRR